MLVLTRKVEQEIVVDARSLMRVLTREITPETGIIRIIVKEIDHGKVRIGIIADKSIVIDRKEVWDKKQADLLHPPS